MNPAIKFILQALLKLSPFIWELLKPWLQRQSETLWKTAFPLARQIVTDLDGKDMPGLQKHALAVTTLKTELIESAKFRPGDIVTADLGGIILAAYNDMFGGAK